VTYNESLTAIGGITRKVEVYEGGIWNNQTIPPIGNKDGALSQFTSLATGSQLYVFGNIPVHYNILRVYRLTFLLTLNYVLLRWMGKW